MCQFLKVLSILLLCGHVGACLCGRAVAGDELSAGHWLQGHWPQWRGPHRDGISAEHGLLGKWPDGGPRVVWDVGRVGVGYSSVVVTGGRIYTQGDIEGREHIIALDAADGSIVWAVRPAPAAKRIGRLVDADLEKFDGNDDGVIDEWEALSTLHQDASGDDGARDSKAGVFRRRRGKRLTDPKEIPNDIVRRFHHFDRPVKGDLEAIAAARVDRLVARRDTNGDGRLADHEVGDFFGQAFVKVDRPLPGADNEAIARTRTAAAFTRIDTNGSGIISAAEGAESYLVRLLRRADKSAEKLKSGEVDAYVTYQELAAYFLNRLPGQDGILNRDELTDYYRDTHPGQDGILDRAEILKIHGGYRNGRGDGPRGTPTVDGDRVYVEGGSGDVTCLDTGTGKTIWHVHLVEDLGGETPSWGFSESPLVDGDLVIVTPGGKRGTLAALRKSTGEVVWRSTAVTQSAHYSSPVIAEIGGVRQIVQFARANLFGVARDSGKHLWNYDRANNQTANVCTPVVQGDHVLVSSAYGTGAGLVKISPADSAQRASEVYFNKRLANHHGGIVLVGEHVYGFGSGGLLCLNFLTGKVAWRDRSVRRGSIVAADGMLYCVGERHEVALVEATPEAYRERGRFKIENLGRPSWAHPVVAGGRLYVRNQERLTAYDLRATVE